jgi:hypothetical protein
MLQRSSATALQRVLVAFVASEEGVTLSPRVEDVAASCVHPVAAPTLLAIAHQHPMAARRGLMRLWAEEGCGDGIAVPAPW